MGFDIFMINHTRREYDCLGTAGEGGNYNCDPNDFVKHWWKKGWRYTDYVEIGEHGQFDDYEYVENADDIEECECFACIRNPDKLYWTNSTKKEAFEIYPKLSANIKYAIEHGWDIDEDDISCGAVKIYCGEYSFLG